MVPFTPRLIPVILSSLAHHVTSIRTAANETNYNLYKVIQTLPDSISEELPVVSSPLPTAISIPLPSVLQGKQPESNASLLRERALSASPTSNPSTSIPFPSIPISSAIGSSSRLPSQDRSHQKNNINHNEPMASLTSQFESMSDYDHNNNIYNNGDHYQMNQSSIYSDRIIGMVDPFDYGATVNALTLQFLNEQEETRVAALEWLLMLHEKAPKKVS